MPIKKVKSKGTIDESNRESKKTATIGKNSKHENTDSNNNKEILNVPRSEIRNTIKWSKVAERSTRGYLIWTGIITLIIFYAEYSGIIDNNNFGLITVILDLALYFVGFILVLIRCDKSYKILLKSGINGLYLDGTAAIYWGALIPIANLFMPMKYIRDIYKNFNQIIGKSFSNALIGRRWGLWLTRLVGTTLINYTGAENPRFRIYRIIAMGSMITSSILFVKIVCRIRKAQKIYLKRTKNL